MKIAGSTYSCVAAPIQQAALTAYADDENIMRYMRDCAAINAIIGRTVSRLYSKIPAVRTTTPAGSFYLYVDFNDCLESFLNVDLRTCEVFCEHLLQVEHVSLLPGSALLLPDSEFSVRSSYIDFDGDAALEAWRQLRPGTKAEEEAFVLQYAELVLSGIENVRHYIETLQSGQRPKHR